MKGLGPFYARIKAAAAFAAAFFMLSGCEGPLPPLLEGLPSTLSAAKETFHQRIRADFPPGSRESDLIQQLGAEGFEPAPYPSGKSVYFERSSFPCKTSARVFWHADKTGAITDIDGFYAVDCP